MKLLTIIWAIVQAALLVSGLLWAIYDRKKKIRRISPYLLILDGAVMVLVFFLILLPFLQE